jgi:hypothetical protein
VTHYTTTQLKKALKIQHTIEFLQSKIDSLTGKLEKVLGGGNGGMPSPFKAGKSARKPKREMSAAAKAKISAAAKLRWKNARAEGRAGSIERPKGRQIFAPGCDMARPSFSPPPLNQ